MVKFKKSIIAFTAVCTLGLTATGVFAASNFSSPIEALASITGRSVASIQSENKALGEIAKEENKLNEFKAETYQIKKDKLDKLVKEGSMTQDEANKILQTTKEKQANCNGEGNGSGKCDMNGQGMGQGKCGMNGQGMGQGKGMGCCK
ncbi:MAG: hypothetical protein RR838_07320 [Clostridium sp.]